MRRLIWALGASVLVWNGVAAAQKTRVDLKTLPATIKNLDWKSVDWNATPPLEQSRALMLLDDVLNEMGSQMAADADLMSQYVDEQNLGEQFAAMAPVEDKHLTQEEAQRVAVAMLRGPMAGSSYATAIGDATGNTLAAYLQMYQSTCDREWASAVESRQQMKALVRFLESSGKMDAFKAWAPGEVERQKKEHEAEMAEKHAAALEKKKQEEDERRQAAQARKEQKEREQAEAALQMQQAMAAAQESQADPAIISSDGSYPDWYYGGLGYAVGLRYRDEAYRGAAVARTENRMAGWRGGGGGRRGGGRRR